MYPLRTGKRNSGGDGSSLDQWRGQHAHLDVLVSHEALTRTPVLSAAPILPEERHGGSSERMQEYAHLAGLVRFAPVPLALLAQGAGATPADAGSVDHAQAAIDFLTLLLHTKLLVGWTAQRPVGLEREIVAREATRFPCGPHLWRSIPGGWSRVWEGRGKSRSKLGDAYRIGMQVMAQFQAEVPHPL